MMIVATPFTSVIAVLVAKIPLAVVPDALKVTVLSLTGFPCLSVTVATRLFAKLLSTTALCPEPEVVAILFAISAKFVNAKSAVPVTFEVGATSIRYN